MRISDWSSDVCSSYLWETQSSWNAVAQNLLGAPTYSPGYRFLFDQDNVDCPWAAALRIRHFLAHNSVDGFEYPHGLTLEQYQNLRRLAAYLMALPEEYAKFDMGWWTADSRSPGATKRSEGRRVGKECVSRCRSRWAPDNSTKN